ncbi:polysaccharide deacetylase family protein [Nocardia brasiliensis]|uniref:polysaccharide deacetylase family protein n=1 Tax=Nocardia brasiliensis TaxID=37326 RepID=UPI0002526AC1|nr:polysaccharide deacetylase family protein [Nocardia brasiliensis]OCF86505.1 polysaccharide deacetylase [Nocardia brasiliensis]
MREGGRDSSRRRLLAVLAAGALSLTAGCSLDNDEAERHVLRPAASPVVHGGPPVPPSRQPGVARIPMPSGVVSAIPGEGDNIALTIDDGTSADVVAAYIRFAKDSGARFTFFVTACYSSWTVNKSMLQPLVDRGQIQLGNHTWDHPDLTRLSDTDVAAQFARTKALLRNNFGVDGTPFYRPPYGYRDARIDALAADHGYAVPVMWYGTLGDHRIITEQELVANARKYFTAQSIVIGHANQRPVTRVYDQLLQIIRDRRLTMVTLDDVFERRH